ncbi:AraC family transcriptional regulator [Mucilaginibacter conchicola]|uniref:AraC family transcriptional regulator n=1 Tax=Mucilaginibacter conchicola TaxID=2303333 RepID=A0A372NQE9_9SPHI|nr:GyrI-like domain-containing protein [Mucilaginibacter conchicola]RFZ90880.1 AraC family transcriptional regulator [Mucilaginibacter conchicola]
MANQFENVPAFFVAGLEVRTINKDGQAMNDIGALWHRLMSEGIADKLEDREGNEIYCVYTDYRSDHNDYYTCILGYKVTSIEYLPEGITGKAIPNARYEVFEPADSNFPANLGEVWQRIWDTAENRAYTSDFEVHTFKSEKDVDTKVYIAVN